MLHPLRLQSIDHLFGAVLQRLRILIQVDRLLYTESLKVRTLAMGGINGLSSFGLRPFDFSVDGAAWRGLGNLVGEGQLVHAVDLLLQLQRLAHLA